MKNMGPKDYYGNILQEGDYISYPARQGSNLFVRTAKILKIGEKEDLVTKKNKAVLSVLTVTKPNHSIKTTITCPWRAILLPKPYVQNSQEHYHLLEK